MVYLVLILCGCGITGGVFGMARRMPNNQEKVAIYGVALTAAIVLATLTIAQEIIPILAEDTMWKALIPQSIVGLASLIGIMRIPEPPQTPVKAKKTS